MCPCLTTETRGLVAGGADTPGDDIIGVLGSLLLLTSISCVELELAAGIGGTAGAIGAEDTGGPPGDIGTGAAAAAASDANAALGLGGALLLGVEIRNFSAPPCCGCCACGGTAAAARVAPGSCPSSLACTGIGGGTAAFLGLPRRGPPGDGSQGVPCNPASNAASALDPGSNRLTDLASCTSPLPTM